MTAHRGSEPATVPPAGRAPSPPASLARATEEIGHLYSEFATVMTEITALRATRLERRWRRDEYDRYLALARDERSLVRRCAAAMRWYDAVRRRSAGFGDHLDPERRNRPAESDPTSR
jgi:hypothetical protein